MQGHWAEGCAGRGPGGHLQCLSAGLCWGEDAGTRRVVQPLCLQLRAGRQVQSPFPSSGDTMSTAVGAVPVVEKEEQSPCFVPFGPVALATQKAPFVTCLLLPSPSREKLALVSLASGGGGQAVPSV